MYFCDFLVIVGCIQVRYINLVRCLYVDIDLVLV
jgi:hypothetical protein